AAALPVTDVQCVDDGGEQLLLQTPADVIFGDGAMQCALVRQVRDEHTEPSPRQRCAERRQAHAVVALKIGLYGPAIVGDDLVEAEDPPKLSTPAYAAYSSNNFSSAVTVSTFGESWIFCHCSGLSNMRRPSSRRPPAIAAIARTSIAGGNVYVSPSNVKVKS